MKWKRITSFRNRHLLPQVVVALAFLMGTSCGFQEKENRRLVIKKCCPRGQELNFRTMCINATGKVDNDKSKETKDGEERKASHVKGNPSKDFSSPLEGVLSLEWFPFASLVNSSTQKPIDDSKMIRNVFDKADIEYGKRPDCEEEEKERTCFRSRLIEQFNLVFCAKEKDIKLYVSKTSFYNTDGRHKMETWSWDSSKHHNPNENSSTKENEGGDLAVKSLFEPIGLRFFPLDDVCFDNGPDESFVVEFCPCKTVPCVRKCCGEEEIFDEKKGKCVPDPLIRNWRPTLKDGDLRSDYYLLSKRYPSTCKKPVWLKLPETDSRRQICGNPENKNKFFFLSDGSLKVEKYVDSIPSRSYCGDHVIFDANVLLENNLLICLEEDALPKFLVYGVAFIFGGIVLLITVLISLYLPELRTSVFNKIIIAHNISLMFCDFIWGWIYLFNDIENSLCTVLDLSSQYTFLTSFFWINVMCFHIFQGIRRLTSCRHVKNSHRFAWYFVYACGTPLIITSITAALEFAPSLPYYIIRPGFGCYSCGFNPVTSALAYYIYIPMGTLIILNVIFYLMTILEVMKTQRETAILQKKDSFVTLNRGTKRFKIFSKLFLLAGLSWVLEIVGWAVGGNDYYWYIPDLFNILRSVVIFIMFICKKRILWSLLGKLKGPTPPTPEERSEAVTKSTDTITTEMEQEEIKRRERILMRQITQTFRRSDESSL